MGGLRRSPACLPALPPRPLPVCFRLRVCSLQRVHTSPTPSGKPEGWEDPGKGEPFCKRARLPRGCCGLQVSPDLLHQALQDMLGRGWPALPPSVRGATAAPPSRCGCSPHPRAASTAAAAPAAERADTPPAMTPQTAPAPPPAPALRPPTGRLLPLQPPPRHKSHRQDSA